MRAGVGESHYRPRMPHHRQHHVLVLVDEGLDEELLQMLLQRQVNHDVEGIFGGLPRDLCDRTIRRQWLCQPKKRNEIWVARPRPERPKRRGYLTARRRPPAPGGGAGAGRPLLPNQPTPPPIAPN